MAPGNRWRQPALKLCERRQNRLQEAAYLCEVCIRRVDTEQRCLSAQMLGRCLLRARLHLMPIYEYRCQKCDEKYEEFLTLSTNDAPPCPKCGSEDVTRLFSRITTEWLPSDVAWDRVGRSWD